MCLQPYYGNEVFINVYLSAGQHYTAQRLRRVKLIIRRYDFSNVPWVISECLAPFVDANIAQGWLQTRLNTGTLVLFCQF